MRILYGVVGEGLGHATRSRVILDHLLRRGHRVQVVVSGRAHAYLREALAGRMDVAFAEIAGLHLVHDDAGIDVLASVFSNLLAAPVSLARNAEVWAELAGAFRPDLVVSDFESWAFAWAVAHEIPFVSLDNMQIIDRCAHPPEVTGWACFDWLLAKVAVKAKLPGADHYLVTSFFFPPVRKVCTTLVPPILRPEVLAARREPGEHVLVYLHAAAARAALPALRAARGPFRLYGLDREGREGSVEYRPFSADGFVEDLRTARAVIAGGGFSLMGEAVHLRVPMLAVPLDGQYEQELNARWLARLGYGAWARSLDAERIAGFLDEVPAHARALAGYRPRDNAAALACVDELVERLGSGEKRPGALRAAPDVGPDA